MRTRLCLFVVALVGAEGGDLTNGRMFAQQPAPSANANSTDASQFSCAAAEGGCLHSSCDGELLRESQ